MKTLNPVKALILLALGFVTFTTQANSQENETLTMGCQIFLKKESPQMWSNSGLATEIVRSGNHFSLQGMTELPQSIRFFESFEEAQVFFGENQYDYLQLPQTTLPDHIIVDGNGNDYEDQLNVVAFSIHEIQRNSPYGKVLPSAVSLVCLIKS